MEEKLTNGFRDLARKQRQVISNYLQNYGIYLGQHRTIFRLQKHPDITMTELAQLLEVSKESLSVSIKRLENGGFVTKSMDEKDKRRTLLRLSEKGETLADACRQGFDDINNAMFQYFNESEKETLSIYFDKMIEGLEDVEVMHEENS